MTAKRIIHIMGSDTIFYVMVVFGPIPMNRNGSLPRYILPGQPQHIIQRGNNRQVIFPTDADYQFFRDAMVEAAGRHEGNWGQIRLLFRISSLTPIRL